jgi:nicotinate-nucleotide pyrophosphorylase (carboxylating)
MLSTAHPGAEYISRQVAAALSEDIEGGDCTASLVASESVFETRVICRQHAILAGRPWFNETFRQLDEHIHITWNCDDGDALSPDIEVCRLHGNARHILTGERTGLNFIQMLSASATLANQYVDAVEGIGVIILDTRKTIPGLRLAQKYAVRCGGASNHRIGLFDAILIKENHIAAVGSIRAAVETARADYPRLLLEVEVETLKQLDEANEANADRVLLDNFTLKKLRKAVKRYSGQIQLEASGGVNLSTVREIAETGVDFISTGDVTKNIAAVDFSMRYL